MIWHTRTAGGSFTEMSVKYGHVTLLSVVEKERRFDAARCRGRMRSRTDAADWQYQRPLQIFDWCQQFVNDWNKHGLSHHCAVGIGHIASKIKKLASLLEVDTVQVC